MCSRFAEVPTSDFSDILHGQGLLPARIRSVTPGRRMAGLCRTVLCPKGVGSPVFAGVGTCEEGEVLVITGVGDGVAVIGELLTAELVRRGAAGVVVDGGVRDLEGIRRQSLPIFASVITPREANWSREAKAAGGGQIQVEVRVGRVTIRPGDLIVGDDDGLIVMPPDIAMATLPDAQKRHQVEEATLRAIQSGRSITELPPYDEGFREL